MWRLQKGEDYLLEGSIEVPISNTSKVCIIETTESLSSRKAGEECREYDIMLF